MNGFDFAEKWQFFGCSESEALSRLSFSVGLMRPLFKLDQKSCPSERIPLSSHAPGQVRLHLRHISVVQER